MIKAFKYVQSISIVFPGDPARPDQCRPAVFCSSNLSEGT